MSASFLSPRFPAVAARELRAGDTVVLEALKTSASSSSSGGGFSSFDSSANAARDFGVVRRLGLDAAAPRFESAADRLRLVGAGVSNRSQLVS